jgi:hypothetical protein
MQEIARQYDLCVVLHKALNLLKTSQGAAWCSARKIVFLYSSTNQTQASKISFESYHLESEYESPK